MRVLVTGAGGFVGRHLCLTLGSEHQVTALTSPRGRGDVALDLCVAADVCAMVQRVKPEGVIHLAARSGLHGLEGLQKLIQENVSMTSNLLEALRMVMPRARTVLVSSSAVYGHVPRPHEAITEAEVLSPVSPYGVSKVAAEAVASVYRTQGMDIVVARPFNLAGPGQSPATVPASFASRIARAKATGATRITAGNLASSRDFTDVRDAARALERLLIAAPDYGPYNICTGRTAVIGSVLSDLQAIAGTTLAVVPDLPSADRQAADISYQCGSPHKIREAVGWEPHLAWHDTLRSVMEDWERRAQEGVLP